MDAVKRAKPIIHGRDHAPFGPDPIPDMFPQGGPTYADQVQAHACNVSYWPMDDVGPGARDVVGAYDLTENAAGFSAAQPFSTQGSYSFDYQQAGPFTGSSSIRFDGDASGFSSYGTLLHTNISGGGAFAGAYTMIGWAFCDASDLATIFSTYDGTTMQAALLRLTTDMYFSVTTTGGTGSANAPVSTSAWHFFAVTYDGALALELFVDGVSVDTGALSTPYTGGTYLRFGAQGTGASGPTNFWRGLMSEFALFDCVLTDAEIAGFAGMNNDPATEAGQVLTTDGSGGTTWSYPTVAFDDPAGRYSTINLGANLTGTDEGDGSITIDAATGPGSGSPADDTLVWMPLTTVSGGTPELVWDGDDSLVPTLVPL